MAKRVKRKKVRKTTKKHFKAPWWKFFFVVAISAFIAIPFSRFNLTNQNSSVLSVNTSAVQGKLNLNRTIKKTIKNNQRVVTYRVPGYGGWVCNPNNPDSKITVRIDVTNLSTGEKNSRTVLANKPGANSDNAPAKQACPGMKRPNNHIFETERDFMTFPGGTEVRFDAYAIVNGKEYKLPGSDVKVTLPTPIPIRTPRRTPTPLLGS